MVWLTVYIDAFGSNRIGLTYRLGTVGWGGSDRAEAAGRGARITRLVAPPRGSLFDVDHVVDVLNSFRSGLDHLTLVSPFTFRPHISASATDHNRGALSYHFS
jgi:hypothetical protein